MGDEATTLLYNVNMAQEINQAKNYAIKSNNKVNELQLNLITIKSEFIIANNKIEELTKKLESLSSLLEEKNKDSSYNYTKL
jgi:chromosome segregation ATPase